MRELDQLLGWYLDNRYSKSEDVQKSAFSTMLDCQDPDLWDWLSGRSVPEHLGWRSVVDAIRTRDSV